MDEKLKTVNESVNLLQLGVNKIQEVLEAYNKTALKEIEAIQSAYETHCLPEEKKCLSLSTLTESNQTLPLYFRMNKEKKVPLFFENGRYPHKALNYWIAQLSQSLISNAIGDMLGYICEYQSQRDERPPGQKGYDYDPTNLFLEEFKAWLVELSKASIETDPQVTGVIRGRIRYLSYIIDHRVFIPSDHSLTREMIVFNLRDILVKNIEPVIELAQLRQSARDHFKLMKLNVQQLIKQGTEFLFYVFRDSPDTPKNFIMAQVRQPTLPNYKTVLSDRSGSLLHYLVNTPAVKLVHPELNIPSGKSPLSQELVGLTVQSLVSNHFLNNENQLIYPLDTQNVCINNWYQGDKNHPSGILSFFQNENCMTAFLKMHQHLEELAIFYLICSLIFELAGEGGNLLVYKCAIKDVNAIIDHYQYFIDEFKENVAILWKASETLQEYIIKKEVPNTKEIQQWQCYKGLSASVYDVMKELIQTSNDIVTKIKAKIRETNTEEYLEWIKKQTEFLSALTNAFCKRSITFVKSEFGELKTKPALPRLVQSRNNDDEDADNGENALEKVVEFYNVAYAAYNQRNYITTEKIVSQLFKDYPQTSLPFLNELLLLRYQSYLNLANFEAAFRDINSLLEAEPDNIQCRLNKASLLYCFYYRYQEAENEIEGVLKLDSKNQKAIAMKKEIEPYLFRGNRLRNY